MARRNAAEVQKIIDAEYNKADVGDYPITKIFNEKSYLKKYKFNHNQIKKIINNFDCKVNIGVANILYRLETYIAAQNAKKKKSKSRKEILKIAMKEFNKKWQHYEQRQEYRRIYIKNIIIENTVYNRIKYFELLNLNLLGEIPNETVQEVVDNTSLDNCNHNDRETESTVSDSDNEFSFSLMEPRVINFYKSKPKETALPKPLSEKTVTTNIVEDVLCSQLPAIFGSAEANSEPLGSYNEFTSVSMPTSTQQLPDSTTI